MKAGAANSRARFFVEGKNGKTDQTDSNGSRRIRHTGGCRGATPPSRRRQKQRSFGSRGWIGAWRLADPRDDPAVSMWFPSDPYPRFSRARHLILLSSRLHFASPEHRESDALFDNRVCEIVRWLSFEPRRSCAAARDQHTNMMIPDVIIGSVRWSRSVELYQISWRV